MFDFGRANDAQKDAISTSEGAVLITAGPGTGKTYTLVQRAIYLIQERGAKPEQILMATFTEKAAKELITRITNELAARNIYVNINEMYIGTFHSICLRMLKEHLEFTQLKKNYKMLDAFDQKYLVFRNIKKFRSIPDIELIMPGGGTWKWAETICGLASTLCEELVDADAMVKDSKTEIRVLAEVLKTYQQLMTDENMLDFAKIQTECFHLLKNNPPILKELQEQIKYLMIDEYQDTNLRQVLRCAERQNGNWSMIKQAEADVSLVQPDYIIEGKIDLIKGDDDTVEIVDFKGERKPDMEKMRDRIEHYRRQLPFLVEQRTGQKVSKMHLYYTGEENGNPMISFPYTQSAIDGTMSAFDKTVHQIMNKEFTKCADSLKTCTECDFRFYCRKK